MLLCLGVCLFFFGKCYSSLILHCSDCRGDTGAFCFRSVRPCPCTSTNGAGRDVWLWLAGPCFRPPVAHFDLTICGWRHRSQRLTLCCILQHTVLMIWFMVTPNIASMEVGTVVLIDQLQLIVTESPLHKLWIAGLVSHFCGCKAGQHAWLCNSSWDAGRELDVQGGKPWLWPSSWSQEWSWSQCPAGYFFNHALDINAIEIGWVFAPRF